MINSIKNYSRIDRSTLNLITAQFFIQIINASFMQVLLIYMATCGYTDSDSANFISYRFLGVLLLSVPLGLFLRGRRIKPLFLVSSLATPFLSILVSQALAIFFLVNLALTQVYCTWAISIGVAGMCYFLRQPLMNMASPLITDVTMTFVGKKNHEIMSALQAAIWSGSWFISSKIFLYLRRADLDYVWVFLITALIYTVSVITFYAMILRSDRIRA